MGNFLAKFSKSLPQIYGIPYRENSFKIVSTLYVRYPNEGFFYEFAHSVFPGESRFLKIVTQARKNTFHTVLTSYNEVFQIYST